MISGETKREEKIIRRKSRQTVYGTVSWLMRNQAKAHIVGQPVMSERLLKLKMFGKNFCAGVEPPEVDMFLLPIPGGRKGTIHVWKWVNWETQRGKDESWTLVRDYVKNSWSLDAQRWEQILGESIRRGNMEEYSRSVPAFSLSIWNVVSLCLANAVYSVFIVCFFHPATT